MANKRKTTTTIVAAVAAAALLLGGTFAWTSISQMAKNEAAGIVNVGGRLHDDFDGTNKDVYVENFTDPMGGGQPIYARVRLDEYMEVGKDAGGVDVDGDGTIDTVPVITGTERDNTETWKPHVPGAACAMCDSGDTCLIHDHWAWTMGGEGDNGGQTTFMPTFNKDKDSLDADVNGTYAGTNPGDKVYYDDYVVYTTDENGGTVNEADKEAYDGEIYSVTGTAQYDNDPDMDKNETEGQYRTETETHTAKETATAKVITMQEWKDTYGSQPGNYWVYDEDGWAYWANPIMPGEATGLLLDGIEMFKNPGEKCYYAINVVGQFATVGDWEQFGVNEEDEDYPSEDALAVLTAASENVPAVDISGESYVTVGTTYSYTATASRGGLSTAAEGDFTWSVVYEDSTPVDASAYTLTETADGATLTVNGNAVPDGTTMLIAARSNDESYLGATGVKAIAIKNPGALIPEVDITLGDSEVANISEIALTADVMHNLAAYENAPIVWSIEDESGNAVPETVATLEGDKLTVVQTEGEVTLVVRATCTLSDNTTTETVTVTFNASEFCDTCGEKYDNGFCPNDACTVGQYQPATLSEGTYQVANGGQLFWFAEQVNASGTTYNATLTEDIDLENKAWTPIGSEKNYSGTFDGNGKSITNLSVTASNGNDGLFGRLGTATVKDFSVSGELTVPGDTNESVGYATIGAVYGNATISGIHSELNVTVEANDGQRIGYVAGILGYLDSVGQNVTVENCSYTGTITGAAGPTYDCIGGIVGYIYAVKPATVNNCLFAGEIKVETGTHMGGILGYYRGGNQGKMAITNCLSYGTLSSGDTGTTLLAAIAGGFRESTGCTVSNNYYFVKDGSNADLNAFGAGSNREEPETEVAPVTEAAITDGTVCSKLTGWTQGTAYPVPNDLTNG